MVRYYIKIAKCLDLNHEHIIDVTKVEVVIRGKKEEDPFDKNKFYTTVYDCRIHQKKVLATFKGDQVYRDDKPPDPLPLVTDVRELKEGIDLDWLTYDAAEQQGLRAYFFERADGYSTLWSTVFTIYSGLLVLFGFMEAGGNSLIQLEWYQKGLFLLPIVFWIAGIFFYFRVFNPTIEKMTPNSPAEIKELCYKANVEKAKNYRRGLSFFSVGIVFIAVALIGGMFWASSSDTPVEKVAFIIKDDYVERVKEIPISMIPEINMTTVVQLHNTTESGYRIGLDDGSIVELNKTWVQRIIWVSNTTQQGSQTA